MSPSYGYSYLTSYGWSGTGTALRKGAIEKPLAIPQKRNLNGLGKDRDEAFPFWDHLFAAASKTIVIKVSSDDNDDDEDPSSRTNPIEPVPIRRTTTGIISNRRPVLGTPASTSGSTTPSPTTDPVAPNAGHLSLLATAKREAAKRGLYTRFFRGPVLSPDGDLHAGNLSSSSEYPSASTPAAEHVGDRGDTRGETKSRKRKSEDGAETKEERRERKRLKKERKAARAAKRAEKALAGGKSKKAKVQLDRKVRKRNEETRSNANDPCQRLKNAHARVHKSPTGLAEDDHIQRNCTSERPGDVHTPTRGGQQNTSSHRSQDIIDAANALNGLLTTKKKSRKRKDTS